MDLITYDNAHKIKNILLNGDFDNKSINLEFKYINTKVSIDGIKKLDKSEVFDDRDMKMVYFLNNLKGYKYHCVNISGNKEGLYINIGQWGVNGNYQYDIPSMHIVLGTTTSKFGSAKGYFSQLEISQSLEDDNYIYIVKNITNLARKGAISRINSGLKNDKDRKHARRTKLVNRLNSEIVSYDNKDWMVINKIDKLDLENKEIHNKVFYHLIKDFIEYSFNIEDIIAEDKQLLENKIM